MSASPPTVAALPGNSSLIYRLALQNHYNYKGVGDSDDVTWTKPHRSSMAWGKQQRPLLLPQQRGSGTSPLWRLAGTSFNSRFPPAPFPLAQGLVVRGGAGGRWVQGWGNGAEWHLAAMPPPAAASDPDATSNGGAVPHTLR